MRVLVLVRDLLLREAPPELAVLMSEFERVEWESLSS